MGICETEQNVLARTVLVTFDLLFLCLQKEMIHIYVCMFLCLNVFFVCLCNYCYILKIMMCVWRRISVRRV